MDFTENRFRGYCDRVLSGSILCKEDHETETGSKGSAGWDSDNASCSAAYSSRILPAFAFSLKGLSEVFCWTILTLK
mgnify:CR=1 FL=1